jgi:hypothetical protein
MNRDVHVIIRFADAEAKQAARISQIKVVSVIAASDVLDDTDMRIDCRINAEPTVIVEPEWPVCSLCGDYIHQSSDAHPDDERWYDTSGDPDCYDNMGAGPLAPYQPGPHVFDGKTRPASDDGEYLTGGAR